MLKKLIVTAVRLCARNSWLVLFTAIVLAAGSAYYAATHFKLDTEVNKLISQKLPWRQRELAYDKAFPQQSAILAVLDGPTPEIVQEAAQRLNATAQPRDRHHPRCQPDAGRAIFSAKRPSLSP